MCWKEETNGEAAHLTVVTESSRNHGTLMTYTLGSLSAEEQESSPPLHMCTSGCRLSKPLPFGALHWLATLILNAW